MILILLNTLLSFPLWALSPTVLAQDPRTTSAVMEDVQKNTDNAILLSELQAQQELENESGLLQLIDHLENGLQQSFSEQEFSKIIENQLSLGFGHRHRQLLMDYFQKRKNQNPLKIESIYECAFAQLMNIDKNLYCQSLSWLSVFKKFKEKPSWLEKIIVNGNELTWFTFKGNSWLPITLRWTFTSNTQDQITWIGTPLEIAEKLQAEIEKPHTQRSIQSSLQMSVVQTDGQLVAWPLPPPVPENSWWSKNKKWVIGSLALGIAAYTFKDKSVVIEK